MENKPLKLKAFQVPHLPLARLVGSSFSASNTPFSGTKKAAKHIAIFSGALGDIELKSSDTVRITSIQSIDEDMLRWASLCEQGKPMFSHLTRAKKFLAAFVSTTDFLHNEKTAVLVSHNSPSLNIAEELAGALNCPFVWIISDEMRVSDLKKVLNRNTWPIFLACDHYDIHQIRKAFPGRIVFHDYDVIPLGIEYGVQHRQVSTASFIAKGDTIIVGPETLDDIFLAAELALSDFSRAQARQTPDLKLINGRYVFTPDGDISSDSGMGALRQAEKCRALLGQIKNAVFEDYKKPKTVYAYDCAQGGPQPLTLKCVSGNRKSYDIILHADDFETLKWLFKFNHQNLDMRDASELLSNARTIWAPDQRFVTLFKTHFLPLSWKKANCCLAVA